MSCLLLSLADGTRRIVECPPGEDPEEVAQKHGTTIYEFCSFLEDAERRLAKDPNGKAVWR